MNVKGIYDARKGRLLALLLAAGVFFYLMEGYQLALFDAARERLGMLQSLYSAYPRAFTAGFVLTYSLLAAFFLPVTVVMSLLAGAIFGLIPGAALVAVGNTIAGTANFLLSRRFLYERVQSQYPKEVEKIRGGIAAHGWMYLMLLRLLPLLPAQVVNLVVGALPFRLFTFIWVTLVFSLPMLAFYVSIGTQLSWFREA